MNKKFNFVHKCYENIELLSGGIFFIALLFILLITLDVIKLIPKQYYYVPKEGDSFPVHGTSFWAIIGYIFVITITNSYLATLYGLWKWKKAYMNTTPPLAGWQIVIVTVGMEAFSTITQALALILAIGHLFYLISIVIAKTMATALVVHSMPLPTDGNKSKMYTINHARKKCGGGMYLSSDECGELI
jgi:hypothetical protein